MFDFPKFARSRGITTATAGHTHCRTGWVQTPCPFCGPIRSDGSAGFHLGWNEERGNFNCWRCGKKGTWDVLGVFLGTSRKDIIAREYYKYQKEGGQRRRKEKLPRKRKLAPIPGTGGLRKVHKRYLRNRGFDPDQLELVWELKGTRHLSGLWNWRILAPIREAGGSEVAWIGRGLHPKVSPKYRITPHDECLIDPKALLYGSHKVPGDSVVVVEGPTDVWRLGPGAVATLGTNWSDEKANIIRRWKRRFIMFDPEKTAERQALRLANWLSVYPGTTELITGLKTDPGGLTQEESLKLMESLGF